MISTAISTSRVNGVEPDTSTVTSSLPEASSTLTYDDLKQFTKTVSTTYLQPVAGPLPPQKTQSNQNPQSNQASQANQASQVATASANDSFGIYFRNYFEGSFYDRYGVNVAKPGFSATIGDTEINGALTMLIEYLLDSVDKTTPVFGDSPSSPAPNGDTIPGPAGTVTFYPGGVKFQPTAFAAGLAQYVFAPATAPTDHPCSITIEKVKFMGEIANAAGASG